MLAVDDDYSEVCVPEWHPGRAFRIPTRLLPAACRHPAAAIRCRVRLASPSAGALNLKDLDGPAPDALCATVPAPLMAPRADPATRPQMGEGCGDIVICATDQHEAYLDGHPGERRGLRITGPVPALEPGARIFIARRDGTIDRVASLVSRSLDTNGSFLKVCGIQPIQGAVRFPGHPESDRRRPAWLWRWWSLEETSLGQPAQGRIPSFSADPNGESYGNPSRRARTEQQNNEGALLRQRKPRARAR